MIFGVILPHRPFADTRCAVRSDNCSFHVLENNPECLKIESQISEISVGGGEILSWGGGERFDHFWESVIGFQCKLVDGGGIFCADSNENCYY